MNTCVRCHGTGRESWFEDGRPQTHICYHCSGSGCVDDEMAFHDRLAEVAHTLAYLHVSEMKKNRDSDPDGEGWNFCAAENMMSSRDYFDMHVYDYAAIYSEQLSNMPLEQQQVLVAWNQQR